MRNPIVCVRQAFGCAALFSVLSVGASAHADAPSELVRFVSLDTLLPSGGIKLSDGRVVENLSDWRSVAISVEKTPPGAPPSFCTATLIGPRLVLTAAHCVWSANSASLRNIIMVFAGATYPVTGCGVPDAYSTDSDPRRDVAVCSLSTTVPNVRPETLDDVTLYEGRPVLLMGYGCRKKYLAGNDTKYDWDPPNARRLRYGAAAIERSGVGDDDEASGAYARTLSAPGQPALCRGDSGGPVWAGTTGGDAVAGRRLSGLNVRDGQGPTPSGDQPSWYSYFLPVSGAGVADFATNWASSRTLQICTRSKPDLSRGVDCRR